MKRTPKGLIMILHESFTQINLQDCINALPKKWQNLDRKPILVTYSDSLNLEDSHSINFAQYALEHRRNYAKEILPVIKAHADFQIVYFGMVQIPLGIDFGNLFPKDRDIEIYQFHNAEKKWYQHFKKEWYQKENKDEIAKRNRIVDPILPSVDQKGISNALVRLSVSHLVNPEETAQVIPNAAEIDLRISSPREAIIDSKEKLIELGTAVKETFDALSRNRSGINVIHFFASIPCGMAFLVGTKISSTIHPNIQTYQYKNAESPKYSKAILLNKKINPSRRISNEDREIATRLRKIADKELRQNIISRFYKQNKIEALERRWPLDLTPINNGIMTDPLWSELPAISKTKIENDQCSSVKNVEDGIVRIANKWNIDDSFFISLFKRHKISKDNNIRKAFRLAFFRETLHNVKHGMGDGKSENIESFPKVLEIADYQADVYSILNEYGFSRLDRTDLSDPKEFFSETIRIAIETMWSFDDQGYDLTQIQIRRLNRYLIWYWQLIRIEKSHNSLDIIVNILGDKPIIELTGLKIIHDNNRLYYNLEKPHSKYLEMAVFYKNQVIRKASSYNFKLEDLIKGIKKMDEELILYELKRFFPPDF